MALFYNLCTIFIWKYHSTNKYTRNDIFNVPDQIRSIRFSGMDQQIFFERFSINNESNNQRNRNYIENCIDNLKAVANDMCDNTDKRSYYKIDYKIRYTPLENRADKRFSWISEYKIVVSPIGFVRLVFFFRFFFTE